LFAVPSPLGRRHRSLFPLGHMNSLRRILQLTVLAIVGLLVLTGSVSLIDLLTGGRLVRLRAEPFSGNVGEQCLLFELATIPPLLAALACWGVVRLFRLRSVHNEVDDTFKPILTVVTGYGRFALIIIAAVYLMLGQGWAAAAHLFIAILLFAEFYLRHRARERSLQSEMLPEEEEEDES
jgi:hypothetical protein